MTNIKKTCSMCEEMAVGLGLCKKHYAAQWYLENKEKSLARSGKWKEENIERSRAGVNAYYQKNKDKLIVSARKRRKEHPEKHKAAIRKWQKENKHIVNAHIATRTARRKGSFGKHTGDEVLRLLSRQRHRCAVCSCDIASGYHKDHIQPLARGGSNFIDNIQLLCRPCNQSKHVKDPIIFMQSRGFLI